MDFSRYNIIWLELCAYPFESVVSTHTHEFFHYIYYVGGVGDIRIGDKTYEFGADNIYLVPPFTEHAFSNKGSDRLETIEIKFSIENPETEEILRSLPSCINTAESPIKSVLHAMYEERRYKKYLSSAIIELNFKLFLSHLLRNEEGVDNSPAEGCYIEERFSPEIDKVVKYIYENLGEELSLNRLAEIAGFEKKYFSRKFRGIKKHTPTEFVKQTRIKKAKELLRYSDMNITQIAEATGFKSIHYFSKQFFECTGMRPLSYKNSYK